MKATLPRLLFIIILNILLYSTLTLNINFSYLIVNLLIIFLFYELHIYKKIINKKLDELKKIIVINVSEINSLPASEHPIIKAAKKDLKTKSLLCIHLDIEQYRYSLQLITSVLLLQKEQIRLFLRPLVLNQLPNLMTLLRLNYAL